MMPNVLVVAEIGAAPVRHRREGFALVIFATLVTPDASQRVSECDPNPQLRYQPDTWHTIRRENGSNACKRPATPRALA